MNRCAGHEVVAVGLMISRGLWKVEEGYSIFGGDLEAVLCRGCDDHRNQAKSGNLQQVADGMAAG